MKIAFESLQRYRNLCGEINSLINYGLSFAGLRANERRLQISLITKWVY